MPAKKPQRHTTVRFGDQLDKKIKANLSDIRRRYGSLTAMTRYLVEREIDRWHKRENGDV